MRLIFFLLVCASPCLFCAGNKPVIVVDAGHGGKDRGAKVWNLEEKRLTLRTSYLVKKHLEEIGYRVVMTRARDIFLPLGARVHLANRRPTSLFVSIHYNSAKAISAKGIEIYYYGRAEVGRRGKSKALATAVLSQMLFQTKGKSRGVKEGNFQVIRETVMPAVLIEAGFLTNREERVSLGSEVYLDKLAKGIALGIDQFVGA